MAGMYSANGEDPLDFAGLCVKIRWLQAVYSQQCIFSLLQASECVAGLPSSKRGSDVGLHQSALIPSD
jgi:hypothetical protein